MVAKNFYDAVLVGLELSTLVAGALLAKRGFRVLLVGEARPWPSYELGGVRLPRAPFALEAPDSPLLARVLSELALRPLMQRRTRPLRPAFQAVMRGHRVDVGPDGRALQEEIEREFPEARRGAEALFARMAANDAQLDALLREDLSWSPEGFFERRAFARATRGTGIGERPEPLPGADLPLVHPLRRILAAAARFGAGGGVVIDERAELDGCALRVCSARLQAAALDEGLTGLYELLLDSIRTHNGSVRLTSRLDALSLRGGAVSDLVLLPSDEQVGCHFVLWGLSAAALSQKLAEPAAIASLFEHGGAPAVRALHYTLNLVVRAEAIPEGLQRDVLLLDDEPRWLEVARLPDGERAVVTVASLLDARAPAEAPEQLATARERTRRALALVSPFLERHVLMVDSPHDGRPPEGLDGAELELDGRERRGPETMQAVYAYPHAHAHGASALPVRTPVKRLLLCNPQVVPGLGLEGLLATALTAARVVTRTLGRGWMNRGRWTKVEL